MKKARFKAGDTVGVGNSWGVVKAVNFRLKSIGPKGQQFTPEYSISFYSGDLKNAGVIPMGESSLKKHSITRKRNSFFGPSATASAKRVVKRRRVQERDTKEAGEIIQALPGGWLKVKWDNRQRPTLIKRSEIRRYPYVRLNPGLIDLVGGMQAIDYLAGKAGIGAKGKGQSAKRNPPSTSTSSDVRSPTRTSTSTKARTTGNITVTGGAGRGATTSVTIRRNPKSNSGNFGHSYHIEDANTGERYGSGNRKYITSLAKILKKEFPTVRFIRIFSPTQKPLVAWREMIINLKKRNPSVSEMSKRFQGSANGKSENFYFSDKAPRLDFSRGGKLVFLKLKGTTIRVPASVVAIDPVTSKLWLGCKNASGMFKRKAAAGEQLDYGPVDAICYLTSKKHIGGGKTYEYVHEFAEEGGRKPSLLIDSEGMPILRGGSYKIEDRGIVN